MTDCSASAVGSGQLWALQEQPEAVRQSLGPTAVGGTPRVDHGGISRYPPPWLLTEVSASARAGIPVRPVRWVSELAEEWYRVGKSSDQTPGAEQIAEPQLPTSPASRRCGRHTHGPRATPPGPAGTGGPWPCDSVYFEGQ